MLTFVQNDAVTAAAGRLGSAGREKGPSGPGARGVAVGARAGMARGVHRPLAEGAQRPAGGDDDGDLATKRARLAPAQEETQRRLVLFFAALDLEGVDGEEVIGLVVAEGDLRRLKLEVERLIERGLLLVGLASRALAVEALQHLLEPGADAGELLLLHPDGRSRGAGADQQ